MYRCPFQQENKSKIQFSHSTAKCEDAFQKLRTKNV